MREASVRMRRFWNDRAREDPFYFVDTRRPYRTARGARLWDDAEQIIDLFSRGRFGSRRFEIGNMDHAVKMGIDVARRIVSGAEEGLWG